MLKQSKPVNLKRDIAMFGAAFLVLNSMIGAGIFALPGQIALNAQLLSPWLFLVVGMLFLSVVLVFVELAKYYDTTGGPILYARDAFGSVAGFSTGWAIFLSRMTAFAANANVMAIYLGSVDEMFATPVARAIIISFVTLSLVWINVVGVKDGVRAMGFFTVLKVTPLILLILAGLSYVTPETLFPNPIFVPDELGATTLLLIYAYVGFETVAVTAGETSKPKQTLPLALISTVMLAGVFYFLIVLVFVAVIPPSDYASATLVDVGVFLAGGIGGIIITIAAVFSIGGNLAGSMLAAPRLLFSMAEHQMLPTLLAKIHPRYATPHIAILVMGAMALVLALSGSFVALALASSVVRLLGFIVCIASLPRVRTKAKTQGMQVPQSALSRVLIPCTALLICGWLLSHSTTEAWTMVGVLLTIGWVLYAFTLLFPVGRRSQLVD